MTLLALAAAPAAAADSYFEAAQQFLEAGKETEARRALAQELRMRPHNLDARYNLAVLLQRIGHADEAERLYEENLQRGPHLPSAVNLSAIHVGRNDTAKARGLLQKAAKQFRHEAVPRYLLAELSEAQGDRASAATFFREALKADPLNGFAHLRYARFLAKGKRRAQAVKHAKRAVKLLPECAPCWQIYGDIMRQGGNDKQALAAYQRAAALMPERAIRLRIIAALEGLGERDRAARMRRALGPDPRP